MKAQSKSGRSVHAKAVKGWETSRRYCGWLLLSLPLAHLYFIIKHLLPHHIALAIGRDDVEKPGE